jgi:hypothetical protein
MSYSVVRMSGSDMRVSMVPDIASLIRATLAYGDNSNANNEKARRAG